MPPLFLTSEELRELTGYAIKARQIAQLRIMGIAFRINGCGRPVVTRAAVEGTAIEQRIPARNDWQPAVLQLSRKAA